MMEPETRTETKATVVINNYNYGPFLRTAIESALAQTYANTEVVVVDDGSTDDSREIIASYGDRVRTVLKPNGGQASAFNAGFAASSGDVICMLDSDDYFYPNKVELAVKALTERPESHWVFHPVCRVFEDGRTQAIPHIPQTVYLDHRAPALRGKLPGPPGPVTSGIVISRSLLETILPMAESIHITADNYVIFLVAALAPGTYLDEVLAVQRIHGNNHYTLRHGRTLTQARVHLLIAHDMRRRFPQLSRLSNRIFCKALADYMKALHRDAICETTIRHYLKEVAYLELPDLLLRTGYHTVRRTFASFAE
jgi:glycosyltransferase involved in cell wall biosynthesis